MQFLVGSSPSSHFLLLHGGAGPMDPSRSGIEKATASLRHIASQALAKCQKASGLDLAARLLEGLEDDEAFNAGYGSALQADGQPRLSAALMNGSEQKFSGVISVSDVRHPSQLALALQARSSRVLTSPGHLRLARELSLPPADLVSPGRLEAWLKKRRDAFPGELGCDTVGALVVKEGLVAGTSTGGRGYEEPGRVSDSATVAGNYATAYAAVSMTGIGEEIVDDGVAVRIETRVRDGMSLEEACRRSFDEALARKREYGWIACDAKGNWCVAHTTPAMSFLVQTLDGQVLASSQP